MLYLMRHGKTNWNIEGKLQGRTNIPLCNIGKAQAEKAREDNAGFTVDVCYCSPLCRARETAEIFLKGKNIPIIIDDRLIEMEFGEYEGVLNTNPKYEIIAPLFNCPEKFVPAKDGETFDEVFKRAKDFCDDIILPQIETGKDILVVGHGVMNTSIYCHLNNISLKDFWNQGIENCKLIKAL